MRILRHTNIFNAIVWLIQEGNNILYIIQINIIHYFNYGSDLFIVNCVDIWDTLIRRNNGCANSRHTSV